MPCQGQTTFGQAKRGDRTAEDGGRQNEVLLRTLKRTRLAQRVHVWVQKKRPAVLIINGEVDCTRSISSLLHIYRKRCTENVSLLVKTKEPNSNSTNQSRLALCSETKAKNEKWQELSIKEKEERKEKRGSKGVSPLALQTQTCQKNNLVLKRWFETSSYFPPSAWKKWPGNTGDRTKLCVLITSITQIEYFWLCIPEIPSKFWNNWCNLAQILQLLSDSGNKPGR